MDADLDLLLIAVYCMADDFLPARPGNARRRISDAELITLCVAQAMMGMPSDCPGPGSPDTLVNKKRLCQDLSEQVLAGFGGRAVAVAFKQPPAVVGDGELTDGRAELLEARKALDPQNLLLERLDELLRAAVGLGLVVVGQRAGDAEVIDLDLVVL